MTEFIQHVIDAVSLGSLYALLALGVALIFGIMGLINFAYGELIMIGAYTLYLAADLPWPLQLVACLIAAMLAAMAMDRAAFRPFRGADGPVLLVTSFALSFALHYFFGDFPRARFASYLSLPAPDWKTVNIHAVVLSAAAIFLLLRMRLGVLSLIALSAAAGVALRFV